MRLSFASRMVAESKIDCSVVRSRLEIDGPVDSIVGNGPPQRGTEGRHRNRDHEHYARNEPDGIEPTGPGSVHSPSLKSTVIRGPIGKQSIHMSLMGELSQVR